MVSFLRLHLFPFPLPVPLWAGKTREREGNIERNKHTVLSCVRAEKQKETWSEVKVMTDVMCPFSSATRHLLLASGVFIYLFDIFPSPSSIWMNVSLYAVRLMFLFFTRLRPLCMMCSCASDATSCACISGVISINFFLRYHCFPLSLSVSIFFSLLQRLGVVTPRTLSFSLSHISLHSIFLQIWYTVSHLNFLPLAVSLPLFSFVGLPSTETRWYSRWAVQHCGFLHV